MEALITLAEDVDFRFVHGLSSPTKDAARATGTWIAPSNALLKLHEDNVALAYGMVRGALETLGFCCEPTTREGMFLVKGKEASERLSQLLGAYTEVDARLAGLSSEENPGVIR